MGLINSIFSVPKGFAPSFANLPTVKINSKIIQKYKKIRFVNFYSPDSDTDCREDGGHLLHCDCDGPRRRILQWI